MGGSLGQAGMRSQDPNNPSPDVGTVKLFENERIRVWDMCVEVGDNTGFHKHEHDYIFMQIGDGKCYTEQVDPSSGDVVKISPVNTVKAQSCNWRTASPSQPSTHRLHNASSNDNYRQILVEFLEPTPHLDAAQTRACLANAVCTTEVGSKLLFENDRCRVHDFSLAPHTGEELPFHHHTLPYFFVNICGGANRPGEGHHGLRGAGLTDDGSPLDLWSQDRDLAYVDVVNGGFADDGKTPEHTHKVWNPWDVPYCSFIVELK